MNFKGTLCVLAIIGLGACTTANTQSASNLQTTEAAEPANATGSETTQMAATDEADGDRVICKRKIVTGSKFKKRICMTWDQWKAQEEAASDFTNTMQRRSGQTNVPGGN